MNRIFGALTTAAGFGAIAIAGWTQIAGVAEARAGGRAARDVAAASFLDEDRDYGNFPLSASSREVRLSPEYKQCIERARGISATRACSAAEHAQLEALLQAAFRTAVMRRSGAAARDALRAEQRAWEASRAQQCRRQAQQDGEAGGARASLAFDSCALHEVVRRTVWLERP